MAGGAKIKKAAGKVKGWLGSAKGDGNALTSEKFGIGRSFSNKFDQRLQDGLDDLLGGALGIRMSKVPEISGEVLDAKEKARLERQKAVTKGARSTDVKGKQVTLQFPINYFGEGGAVNTTGGDDAAGTTTLNFPNSIHFRTLPRKEQDHSEPPNAGNAKIKGADGKTKRGFMQTERGTAWRDQDVGSHGSVDPSKECNYDIFLHLPEKVADEVKVEYAEAKAGALQQFFARLFSGGDSDASNVTGEQNFDMNEIMSSFKNMMPGGEIMQKAAGHMTNPMVFQTLKNVNFRSYSYSFKLNPTSPQEAEMIKSILFAFKKSMLPGTAGENNMIWTLPNEWVIQFQGPIRDWVEFPLVAVCTSATVDYGPTLMAGDSSGAGQGSPSSMTLALNFIETAQLSRQKYTWEVSPLAGEIRQGFAEKGTQLGSLARASDEQIAQLQTGGGSATTDESGDNTTHVDPDE